VVAEPDYFDEEQKLEPGPDPDPHKNDKGMRIVVKSLFRIRINVMRAATPVNINVYYDDYF
jgi:hypothetical protein